MKELLQNILYVGMVILYVGVTMLFVGCDSAESKKVVSFQQLFSITGQESWWKYSDEEGNLFSVTVGQVVTDDKTTYYKVTFLESNPERSEESWFMEKEGTLYYSSSLQGTYAQFLPSEYYQDGGSFDCNGQEARYTIESSLTLDEKTYSDVVTLEYSNRILNGFNTIHFANTIGPLQFIDDGGRRPIIYTLDSLYVNGSVIRY